MTIFIDASAIVAMIAREPEANRFAQYLAPEESRLTSPIALWEAVRGVANARGIEIDEARALVADFVRESALQLVPIDAEIGELALDAHQQYGKGVHEAWLNMGDCFAYACTKKHDAEIMFKGDDFIHTDLKDAMLP